jgi:hypothetical protein
MSSKNVRRIIYHPQNPLEPPFPCVNYNVNGVVKTVNVGLNDIVDTVLYLDSYVVVLLCFNSDMKTLRGGCTLKLCESSLISHKRGD